MPNPKEYGEKRLAELLGGSYGPCPDPEPEPETPTPRSKGGPKTLAGKQKTCLNALRHGLTGRTVVMPEEDLELYRIFALEYTTFLKPESPVERQLAQTAADTQWRLNRVKSIEDCMLALGLIEPVYAVTMDDKVDDALATAQTFRDHSRDFANLSIYEHRLHRILEKSIAQLKALQAERQAKLQAAMDDAILLKQFDEMEGRSNDPALDGFVFSAAAVSAEFQRRTRLENARLAKTYDFNRKKYQQEGFLKAA